MKKSKMLIMFLLCFTVSIGFSQEKTRRQIKAEQKIQKQKEVEKLIDSREFQFVARNSNSQSFRMIDLTLNPNFVKFKPDFIKSDMPFFGRGYSGLGYTSDTGLKFEGKPEKYNTKLSNKEYQIKASVKGQNDFFDLTLLVSFDGSGILTINSNNRAPITYFGEIMPIKEDKKE